MKAINRTALLFQPKQPFIDWLNDNDKSSYVYKLNERKNESGLYLIEEAKGYKEVQNLLSKNYKNYFERELEKYPFDKQTWPDTSDFEIFKQWLDFTYHTLVYDTCDLPLEKEEL